MDTFKCGRCGQRKQSDAFAPSQRKEGRWCRDCMREWYVARSGGMVVRSCDWCGVEMLCTGRRAKELRVFHSKECKDAARNAETARQLAESKIERVCEFCGEPIPGKRSDSKYCRHACAQKAARQRDPTRRRRYALRHTYGLTLEDYDLMLARQGGVCAICGTAKPNGFGKFLAVDHCHDTGRIRGLLCGNCNHGLGKFDHDPKRLRRAIRYLQAH